MSSYVRRLRSDRPNPVGVWPVGSGRTPYQEKPVSKMSCKAPSGQRPLCTESAHTRDWFAGSKWTRADIPSNCAAASVVDRCWSKSRSTSSLRAAPAPIAHQPNRHSWHPRKSPGQCHL